MRAASEPEVVIVGGGIAGCEAAWRCAELGRDTLLVTTSLDTLYNLAHATVNLQPPPGTLLRDLAPTLTSESGDIESRQLHLAVKRSLEAHPRLHLLQSTASSLLVEAGVVVGVGTWEGIDRRGRVVALCAGSFLRARLSLGAVVEQQGRLSEMAYDDLYEDLLEVGFEFAETSLSLPAVAGSLPYRVTTVAFAASEAADDPAPSATGPTRLRRLDGLWTAGVCAPRPQGSEVPGYATVAAQGFALGAALAGAAPL